MSWDLGVQKDHEEGQLPRRQLFWSDLTRRHFMLERNQIAVKKNWDFGYYPVLIDYSQRIRLPQHNPRFFLYATLAIRYLEFVPLKLASVAILFWKLFQKEQFCLKDFLCWRCKFSGVLQTSNTKSWVLCYFVAQELSHWPPRRVA